MLVEFFSSKVRELEAHSAKGHRDQNANLESTGCVLTSVLEGQYLFQGGGEGKR